MSIGDGCLRVRDNLYQRETPKRVSAAPRTTPLPVGLDREQRAERNDSDFFCLLFISCYSIVIDLLNISIIIIIIYKYNYIKRNI